jgi:hypothetical protein
MKTKYVATTADELLRLVSKVRDSNDKTPSARASLVFTEHGDVRVVSDTADIEGVTTQDILKAIADRLGFDSIVILDKPAAPRPPFSPRTA